MGNITITTLKPDEWAKYKAIRLQALQEDPIAFADNYEKAKGYESSFWSNALSDSGKLWFFASDAGEIVGMIGAHITNTNGEKIAVPVGVFVANSHKGKGIGTLLMEKLLKEIKKQKEIKIIKLYVAETQLPAISLYKKFGFAFVGKKEKEIQVGDKFIDELIMEKKAKEDVWQERRTGKARNIIHIRQQ